MNAKPWTLAIAAAAAIGCGMPANEDAGADARANDVRIVDSASPTDSGSPDDSAVEQDSGVDIDSGTPTDSGVAMDARTDAPTARDVATDSRVDARTDSGVAVDSGIRADAGLALMNVPTCTAANVTAAMLYTGVVTTSCTGSRCHDPGSGGTLSMGSAGQMRTNLLMASRAGMPRVTPRDLNNSYVMYKLLNQHMRVPGGAGNRMPPGGALNNTQLCLFVNWIRSGAM